MDSKDTILKCGASKVLINPEAALMPDLFGLMGRKYCKIQDNLYLRVLAIGSGDQTALVIVYDLDKAPYPVEWKKDIQNATGISPERILYSAIHTHTAPLTGYRPFEGPNFIERKSEEEKKATAAYESMLHVRLMEAVDEAIADMRPARLGYGAGECDINMNRVQRYTIRDDNGEVSNAIQLGRDIHGVIDRTQFVMKFEDAGTGSVIGFLSNYGVHCVAGFLNDCGDGRSYISGDIAGAVSRALEAEYEGSVFVWTSAAAGDMNPVMMLQNFVADHQTGKPSEKVIPGEEAGIIVTEYLAGREIDSIREVLSGISCDETDIELEASERIAHARIHKGAYEPSGMSYEDDYPITLHLLRIGKVALIGVNGEIYTRLARSIKDISPYEHTYIVSHDSSLVPDNPGYILDDETRDEIMALSGNGRVPGARSFTQPGTVKQALVKTAKELFNLTE